MRNRPAAGKRVAGVEIKHIWLPGESEWNKRLFWHHLGQSQDLQPLWSGVRMLSKEVSVDTCLTVSINLFKVSQRGTLDAEISTECLLPGARLRCWALKEGNSVGWPRYTWTVHIQNVLLWWKIKCTLLPWIQTPMQRESHHWSWALMVLNF